MSRGVKWENWTIGRGKIGHERMIEVNKSEKRGKVGQKTMIEINEKKEK